MTISETEGGEALCGEILAESRRQAGEIVQRARDEAARLLAAADAAAEQNRQEQLAQAAAGAQRRRELILATVPVEVNRQRQARMEALLQSIHDEVHRHIEALDGSARRAAAIALAAAAVRRMRGDAFTVRLAPADDKAGGGDLAGAIAQRAERPGVRIAVRADPAVTGGGVVVDDDTGRQAWDNRLPARLERLWPALRLAIARGMPWFGEDA